MDFDKYKNTLPYPTKEQFTTKFWYKEGQTIARQLPGQSIEYLVTNIAPNRDIRTLNAICETTVDEEGLRVARRAYGEETARLTAQFKADLFEDLGISDHPMREKLYSKAWEDGHSAGFSEVYNVASDLVDLIAVPQGFALVGAELIMFGGICPSADADRAAKRLAKEL